MIRITSIESTPFWEIDYQSASPWQQPVDMKLPLLRGTVDRLPAGLEAILVTADLQGREPAYVGSTDARLLGHRLADELALLSDSGEIPSLSSIGVILAGDFYTVPHLDKMAGTGDVRPVWRDFAERCQWVAGVAGNHDLFSENIVRPLADDFESEPGIHFLDDSIVEIDGAKIAGLSGIIGRPTKLWRRSEEEYVAALKRILASAPDIIVMHDGPGVPDRKLRGTEAIQETLETSAHRPLVIRGHAHWDEPLAELANGIQVLNVDARAMLLRREG